MKLLTSKKLKDIKFKKLAQQVIELKKKNINPKLAVILLGSDPASEIYVKHKEAACKTLGIESLVIRLSDETTQEELLKEIDKLNNDNTINGILVQFPIPKGINKEEITKAVLPSKDVDGMNPINREIVKINDGRYAPKVCTAEGIMELLKFYNINIANKNVVVYGRSNIVGTPIAELMVNSKANVSVVHSETNKEYIVKVTKDADVIISATGIRELIKPKDVKWGVVIVDVGVHRLPNNKVVGDIDRYLFEEVASAITPVPGGVGPMTIVMLTQNLVDLCKETQ